MITKIKILCGFLIVIFPGHLFGQTEWEKYQNNPVMVKDTTLAGTWEWAGIGQPTCLVENDTFKMWYVAAGVPTLDDTTYRGRISYAYSLDGINWVKHGPAVLDVGLPGEWDSEWLDTPGILRDQTGYKLYYFGNSVWREEPRPVHSAIGLATSTDGINWQRCEINPVLEKGDSLNWDGVWVESPAVLYDNDEDIYKMWYTGAAFDWKIRIGYATSPDGKIWTKHHQNPVVDVGDSGSWDDLWAAVPAVRKLGNLYQMWYSGVSVADLFDTVRVGYAYSLNGIDWTRHPGNPVLSASDPPVDSSGPWAPDVVFNGTEYKMWYEAAGGLFLATSSPSSSIEQIYTSPQGFHLWQNYPNPFNPETMIWYQLPHAAEVEISILNLQGQKVATLMKDYRKAGFHKTIWNGTDKSGKPVASGVYFYQLKAGDSVEIKKMMLLR